VLTLAVKEGATVQVGDHTLEVKSTRGPEYVVVRWAAPGDGRQTRALERPVEGRRDADRWLELEPGVKVAVSKHAKGRSNRARLAFDAPESVDVDVG